MREALAEIYREWVNDFLSIDAYADYYHIELEEAYMLIQLGRRFHNELAEAK